MIKKECILEQSLIMKIGENLYSRYIQSPELYIFKI